MLRDGRSLLFSFAGVLAMVGCSDQGKDSGDGISGGGAAIEIEASTGNGSSGGSGSGSGSGGAGTGTGGDVGADDGTDSDGGDEAADDGGDDSSDDGDGGDGGGDGSDEGGGEGGDEGGDDGHEHSDVVGWYFLGVLESFELSCSILWEYSGTSGSCPGCDLAFDITGVVNDDTCGEAGDISGTLGWNSESVTFNGNYIGAVAGGGGFVYWFNYAYVAYEYYYSGDLPYYYYGYAFY